MTQINSNYDADGVTGVIYASSVIGNHINRAKVIEKMSLGKLDGIDNSNANRRFGHGDNFRGRYVDFIA